MIKHRKPATGLIFHTDRGIEFTGHRFRQELKKHNIVPSVNRLGHCTDNGHMGSFYHSLKDELIRGRVFQFMPELRYALNGYINHFYNHKRLHLGVGYQTPVGYEKRMHEKTGVHFIGGRSRKTRARELYVRYMSRSTLI